MPPKKFTSEYQPKKNGRKKGSTVTDALRRLSHTKINYLNPITGVKDKASVNEVVALQLVLKATQDSDLPSIKEYFDRTDGKVVDKTELSGKLNVTQMGTVKVDGKPINLSVGE